MANLCHYRIIREGVEVWNRWRTENPSVKPDLSAADLSRSPHFDMEDPFSNYLKSANFRSTNFRGSWLVDVCLVGSDFDAADLTGAQLQGSSLRSASLRRATLVSTRLDHCDIHEADLSGALVGELYWIGVDLSSTTGLGQLRHHSTSCIDEVTLRSTGMGFVKKRRSLDELLNFLTASGNPDLVQALQLIVEGNFSAAVTGTTLTKTVAFTHNASPSTGCTAVALSGSDDFKVASS